jgi:hypothetical protein
MNHDNIIHRFMHILKLSLLFCGNLTFPCKHPLVCYNWLENRAPKTT